MAVREAFATTDRDILSMSERILGSERPKYFTDGPQQCYSAETSRALTPWHLDSSVDTVREHGVSGVKALTQGAAS